MSAGSETLNCILSRITKHKNKQHLLGEALRPTAATRDGLSRSRRRYPSCGHSRNGRRFALKPACSLNSSMSSPSKRCPVPEKSGREERVRTVALPGVEKALRFAPGQTIRSYPSQRGRNANTRSMPGQTIRSYPSQHGQSAVATIFLSPTRSGESGN
jgi:hypothetical protein